MWQPDDYLPNASWLTSNHLKTSWWLIASWRLTDFGLLNRLTLYLSALDFCNSPVWNIEFDELDFFSSFNHTGAMLVTRARANSSKNHTLLMCRIWKMGRNLFSSLDIRDNFKVAFLEKNSNNPKIYLVTITVWGTGSVINWVNLSCWLPDLKVDIWQNLPKKCHFQIISHVQWWTNFFFHFCILHIKNVWILLKLEMALVTTIEMKFALVCIMFIYKILYIISLEYVQFYLKI